MGQIDSTIKMKQEDSGPVETLSKIKGEFSMCIPDFVPVIDTFSESSILPPLGFMML